MVPVNDLGVESSVDLRGLTVRPGGRLAPPGAGRYLQLDVVADGEALLAPAITKMGLF